MSTRSPFLTAVAFAITTVALIACASSKRSPVSSAPEAIPNDAAGQTQAPEWELTRKEEIRAAWDKIGELRQDPKLGLSREPSSPMSAATSLADLRQCVEEAGTPEPAVSASCSDVCNIKDAICDNAEDICRIADELDGDVWAADKCNSAKTSCKEAKEICCGCIEEG